MALLWSAILAVAIDDTPQQDLGDLLAQLEQRERLVPPGSLMPIVINPYSPYYLCNHHFGGEDDAFADDHPRSKIVIHALNASTAASVKACDIICVDALAFDAFAANILPLITANFILFTHRWCLPQLHRSEVTDAVRAHKHVHHWFAQNPVYASDERYSAFPYGIHHGILERFATAFVLHHRRTVPLPKNHTIEHLHLSASHPSREKLIARHAQGGGGRSEPMQSPEYYAKIELTKFMISPRGDRPDTYRHWESIAFGALPIANIDPMLYRPLYGDDMIYVNDTETLLDYLDRPELLQGLYHPPQSHRVSSLYWARKVEQVEASCRAGVVEGKSV